VLSTDLDLSITDPWAALPDDGPVLARYPALRGFRAGLGDTPLIEVPGPPGGARILAKDESGNPFGSVKDRAAYALLCDAVLRHGDTPRPLRLVDFSGGNMARALGGLGHLTGVPIRLAMPAGTPPSLLRRLEADGVRIDFVPTEQFLYGIMRRAAEIATAEPDWTMLRQHRNVGNVAVHEFGTGQELLMQLDGAVPAAWVAAIGTGGTIAGVARALRREFPTLTVVAVSPAELPYGTTEPPNARPKFAGSGGIGHGHRQPFVDVFVPDARQRTVTHARALAGMAEYRRLTGSTIGASSAANWLIAREIAADLPPNRVVVTLFADAGTAEDWARIEAAGPPDPVPGVVRAASDN
jgi:cysteine synthase A